MASNTIPKHLRHIARPAGKDREYFTNNFVMLLIAGVPISQALGSLEETTRSKRMKRALQRMRYDIDNGLSLGKALRTSRFVSRQTLSLVELGEASGRLIENLKVAVRQEEKQRLFKAKIRSALLYPTFVIGLTVIVGLGVAWFLLPRLAETFEDLEVELPLISQILIGVGAFLQQYGIIAVPVGIGVVLLLIYILFFAPKTRSIGQHILFVTPGIKKLLLEVELARFGYLLGTLLDAGLNVSQAFLALESATGMPQYQGLYRHMRSSIEDGYSFKDSIKQYHRVNKYIPPAVQQMIIAGEQSGALPETLRNIGSIYEEKATITTDNLEATIEPILLIVVWLGVMAVAVAVIVPIYSLIGGLDVS
ncbi:MAG TPA: type II secretion system F family protein [Candidatus Saccharimonadales bacterium]